LYKNNSFEIQNNESLRSNSNDKDSSLPPHEFGSVQNDGETDSEDLLKEKEKIFRDF
jgi:hypothetical protein